MSNEQPAVQHPAVQHIVNLVVRNSNGQVLLARYDAAKGHKDEPDPGDIKWWLPAHELEPYQHPDEAAIIALDAVGGLDVTVAGMHRVQSFRGRRGWHISFDYLVDATGEPNGRVPAEWHDLDDLPPTMHGNWERETIAGVLAEAAD